MANPQDIRVPDLVGSTQQAAETLLKSAALAVGTATTASSVSTPTGSVISTNPSSGTMVPPGSPVNLEVSSGPAQVVVPNISGLTQVAAEAMLKSAGLTVGSLSTERSSTVPAGGVASTNPAAGTPVSQGTAIDLEVSTGPKGDWTQTLLPATFGILGVGLLGIIVWGITDRTEGGFLAQLADEQTARGLITFLIAITTVGIAVILAISTIVLKESPENEKRFDRGKQVLTILIGVLGTIVGFYFGAAQDVETPSRNAGQAQTLTITTNELPPGIAKMAYPSTTLLASGGTGSLTWSVTPALPADLALDAATGEISGIPMTTLPATRFTFSVTDSSTPPVSANTDLTLQINASTGEGAP